LAALIEGVVGVEAVEHGRHPPGEALRFPDAAQASFGIALEKMSFPGGVKFRECFRQDAHVGHGQVESFGARWRDDVRGVAGQKHLAVLHGLDDVTSHAGDVLLKDRAFVEFPVAIRGGSQLEFAPDAIVGPGINVFIVRHLEIEPANFASTHGQQSEAAFVVVINQFLRRGWRLRKYAQPAEWVLSVEFGKHTCGEAGAADSVKAVAACDVIAMEFFRRARRTKTDGRVRGINAVYADVAYLEYDRETRLKSRRNQILDHFLLGVNRDRLASGQIVKVDAVASAVESQSNAVVSEGFALETFADAGLDKQIDGALFKQARADTLLDVFPGSRFENDGFYPLQVEQMGEDQSRRTCSDNADLRAHCFPLPAQ
jgi:hypothetical protein